MLSNEIEITILLLPFTYQKYFVLTNLIPIAVATVNNTFNKSKVLFLI